MAKDEIKVFIDSNVIISGLLSDRAAPRLILDLLCHELPFIQAATGRYNIDEIQRTLTRKLPAAAPVFRDFMPRLKLEIVPLAERKMLETYRGVIVDEDLPVLASAVAWGADYLVTGDKKHFGGLRRNKNTPLDICSPAEFVEILEEKIREAIG
jgi:predicted nucleic acid-binding protein